MKKILSSILLIVMVATMASSFVACDLIDNLIPLEIKHQFAELDDYVLYDETIEYQGILYQNSNLGYIGVGLADSSLTHVFMRGYLDYGFGADGLIITTPVYAYATDFLCNNQTVTSIWLDLYSNLRLYENAVHDVPNVTEFSFVDISADYYDNGKGTPQIEKNAINVDCDYTVGSDIFIAFQCFPLDVEKFVFSLGIGIYTKLKVVFDPPKNGVQPLTGELYAPCTATVGKHKATFNNPYLTIKSEGLNASNEYYYSVEIRNVILEEGCKLPKEWIPKTDYFTFDLQFGLDLTYQQKKIIVFESTKKHRLTASNVSVPFDKYTHHDINDNAYVTIESSLTGFDWRFE